MRALLRDLDVFVPTGAVMLAQQLLTWSVAILPAAFTDELSINVIGFPLSVSVLVVGFFLLTVVQLTWTTLVLFDVSAGRAVDLVLSRSRTRSRFWRGALGVLIGSGGALAAVVVVLPLFPSLNILAVFVMALLAAAWNVLSLALLPTVLCQRGPVGAAVGRAFRSSPACSLQVAGALFWSMILYGFVSFAYTSFSEWGRSASNYKVHSAVKWVPNLPSDSGWYATWCDALEVEENTFVVFLLSLPLLVLGLALSLRVIDVLRRGLGVEALEPDSDLVPPPPEPPPAV